MNMRNYFKVNFQPWAFAANGVFINSWNTDAFAKIVDFTIKH